MSNKYVAVDGQLVTVDGKAVTVSSDVAGNDGATFTPSVSDDGWLSWTNDGGLDNPDPVNIKGEKGDKGDTGATGATGATGEPGEDGASVTVQSVSESAEDGGSNVVTFSDGKTLNVKNGNTGARGDPGDDYVLTEEDKEEIAALAAPLVETGGTGDMQKSVYDPQGKATDIFAALGVKQDTITALGMLKNTSAGVGAAVANLDYARPSVGKTVSLPAASWDATNKTQAVTVSGALASETAQCITVAPVMASQEAYIAAGIRCVGQAADTLTFKADTVPTDDLVVIVKMERMVNS